MSAQSMPSNVTNQVPETKNLLFVKLPDRIVLIDPDNKLVTQSHSDRHGQHHDGFEHLEYRRIDYQYFGPAFTVTTRSWTALGG